VLAVSVKDAAGRLVPTAGNKIHFSVRGPGRIIGVGNGDPSSLEPDCFVGSAAAQRLGSWKAPEASVVNGLNTFETTFAAPEVPAGGSASLLLNALGTGQTVTLNGQPLYTNAAPDQARAEFSLAKLNLKRKGNVLRIEATRFTEWGAREALQQVHPASLRIETPASAWSRSVFNGLAQVIIQSTGEPGAIVVEATADGLTLGTASIAAKR
jgi:beta-galactosidase